MQPPVTPLLSDLVVIPFTLFFLGCAVYVAAILNGRQSGSLPLWRWAGAVSVLAGVLVAWSPAWDAMNPSTGSIYRLMLTRKLTIVQIGTPFVGIALLLGIAAVELLTKRYLRVHFAD